MKWERERDFCKSINGHEMRTMPLPTQCMNFLSIPTPYFNNSNRNTYTLFPSWMWCSLQLDFSPFVVCNALSLSLSSVLWIVCYFPLSWSHNSCRSSRQGINFFSFLYLATFAANAFRLFVSLLSASFTPRAFWLLFYSISLFLSLRVFPPKWLTTSKVKVCLKWCPMKMLSN